MLPLDPNSTLPVPQSAQPNGDQGPEQYPLVVSEHVPVNPVIGPHGLPEISGATILQALRRRWLLAVSLGLLCAALAVMLTCWAVPPKYRAQTLIHVAARPAKAVFSNQGDYMSTDEFTAFMKTQMAVVKSKPVLQAALRQPQIAELAEVSNQPDPPQWLEKNLEVDTGLGVEILRISLSGDRPEEIATLLNAIADGYLQQMAQAEQVKSVARIEQLQENFRQYQESLRRKRAALKELGDQLGLDGALTLTPRYTAALQQLGSLESQLLTAKLELNRTSKELASLLEREKKPVSVTVTDIAIDEYLRLDPAQSRLLARLNTIEDQIQQIRLVAKGDVQSKSLQGPLEQRDTIQAAIDARRKEVRPQVQAQLERKALEERAASMVRLKTDKVTFEDKVKTLDEEVKRRAAVVKQLDSTIGQPGKPASDLEVLGDEVAQMDATAKRVADQLQIMRVEPRPPLRASVLEPAEPPRSKNFQVQIKMASAAGFGALALAVFGVSWREYRSRRIYAPADVVEGLGMTLIGTLPALPANARIFSLEANNGRAHGWQSVLSEAVDALRAQLLRAADRDGLRVVMITSANSGEGKTSLAGQLAASLARAWRKTLLIDGDLRHPGIHRQFDMPQEPGFSDVLRGELECDDAIRPTPLPRLWMMPAGQCDAHATQALAQKEVRILLNRLKEQYDFIVLDSSPVLPVADALSLGQHVDAVVFSILRNVSRLPAVQASQQRLSSLGIRMLGTVVLGTNAEAGNLGYPYPARANP